jgi:zinc protease
MRRVGRLGPAGATLALLTWATLAPLACASPPAWEQPPPPPAEGPVVAPGQLHRSTLENGLEVIVLEDHRRPRVALGVVARRGAGSLDPAQAGLAQYTAELLERGAGKRDAIAFARFVDEIGATLETGATHDAMSVSVSGLARDLGRLEEILADVVLRPRFDRAEAEKARSEQLAALEQGKDRPATLALWAFQRALYEGHPYGVPVEGTRQAVARLDAKAARSFHGRVFQPGNVVLWATGDLDPAAFLEAARASFGAWARGKPPAEDPAPPAETPSARRIVIVDRPDLVQSQIFIGHEGISRTDPDRVAVGLMNMVLGGGGFSSRLMARVRSEEGLTYGVYSGFAQRRHPGSFYVATSTRVAETRRVIDLLLGELVRHRETPPTAEELANAQSYASGSFALSLETSDAVTAALVDLRVYGLPDDSLDTYRRRVRQVTVADTARQATARLHPDRAAIVVVGPAAALRGQLETLGPTEVVSP